MKYKFRFSLIPFFIVLVTIIFLSSCSLEVSVNKDDSVSLNFVHDLNTEYDSLVEHYKIYCNKLNACCKKENVKIDYFKSDNIYITIKIKDINLFDDYSCLINFKIFNKNIDLLGSDGKIENSLEMDKSRDYSIIYIDQDKSNIFIAYEEVFSDFWLNENLDFSISFPGRIYYTYGKVTYEESNPQKAKVSLGGGAFAVVYDYTSLHMVNIVLILTKILSVLNLILAIMSLVKEIKHYDDYDNVVGTIIYSFLWILSGIWNFIILVELFSINKIIDLVISIILAIASILRIVIRHAD